VKTQQATVQTRRLRTQLNRLNDRIATHTNAIIRTRDQQSEVPAVATNHQNSISQLSRSIAAATNRLEALQADIERTVNDDRTFVVKELEEEVKLEYAENIGLHRKLDETAAEIECVTRKLEAAARRASPPIVGLLQTQSRELMRQNENSRAKVTAYFVRRRRVEIEAVVCENIKKKVPVARTMEESDQFRRELLQRMAEREVMAAEKAEFQKKMKELAEIIERQKRVITDCLVGEFGAPEEEEDGPCQDKDEELLD
jgi:hypothetical protein